jgi:hypothetical protein
VSEAIQDLAGKSQQIGTIVQTLLGLDRANERLQPGDRHQASAIAESPATLRGLVGRFRIDAATDSH